MRQLREILQDGEFQLVLDAYIREMGLEDWNWRQVQEKAQVLVDLQLVRAEYSQYFFALYKTLGDDSDSGTVPPEMTANQIMALKEQLQCSSLNQNELTLCKKAFQNYASVYEERLRTGQARTCDDRASNRAKYLGSLSMHFDVRAAY